MSNDTIDKSFAPPKWAVTCWLNASGTEIYVILPAKDGGVPYIIKYPADVKGLNHVLHILKTETKPEGPMPQGRLVKSKERQPNASDVIRERARQALKRKGIL